jgi:hypothetical protein
MCPGCVSVVHPAHVQPGTGNVPLRRHFTSAIATPGRVTPAVRHTRRNPDSETPGHIWLAVPINTQP